MTFFEKYFTGKLVLLVTGILLIILWCASYFIYHIVGLIQLFFLILFILIMVNFLKAIRKEKIEKENTADNNG
jgi:hypothetical protein